jgi:hypothetical protein
MRSIPYFLAAAAIGGLALATPSLASPLANGLSGASTVPAELNEGLVQNVHRWHCKRRYSNRLGWHRHRRACGYSYYPYYAPSFSFGLFIDDDDGRRHKRKFRRHRKHKKDYDD